MPSLWVVNHIYTNMCFHNWHSIPRREAGNNPDGKLWQLHADILASSTHSDLFHNPPAKLKSPLPQLSPLPLFPDATQNGSATSACLRLSFQSLSSRWSQPLKNWDIKTSSMPSHKLRVLRPALGMDTPSGSAFPQLWGVGVSILWSPSKEGQTTDLLQLQRRGNKASLRTGYRWPKNLQV